MCSTMTVSLLRHNLAVTVKKSSA